MYCVIMRNSKRIRIYNPPYTVHYRNILFTMPYNKFHGMQITLYTVVGILYHISCKLQNVL